MDRRWLAGKFDVSFYFTVTVCDLVLCVKKCTEFWLEYMKERTLLERPRHKLENNIKMDLLEVGECGLDSFCSEQ